MSDVKVGDVVKDAALLEEGTSVHWCDAPPLNSFVVPREWASSSRPDKGWVAAIGVRILALPPPKCAPGCSPATPCRTDGVCPVFAEEEADEGMREEFHASGLVPEGLYESRPTRFLPLQHAANGGFAIWGRR